MFLRRLGGQELGQVLLGEVFAHIGYAMAPRVDEYKVPMLYPVIAADDLTQRKPARWVVRNLSYGEQRQLEIALALAGSPRLLLLDEPTAGLSPAEASMITTLLQQLAPAVTILIIEHDMDVAFALTQSITVLHYGRVIADGLAEEVKADPLVQQIYLGSA